MGSALNAAVTGLQASQTMLDVAGSNLANLNTTAYKSSAVSFAETLSNTLRSAGSPTEDTGGTNPVQVGTGVSVAGVVRKMVQGDIVSTGNDYDMAIKGEGYFVLSDGEQTLFTRDGSFDLDENGLLIDSATGYPVQRVGSTGEVEGFQQAGNSNIYISKDSMISARATTSVVLDGNLRAGNANTASQNVVASATPLTSASMAATSNTLFSALDQFATQPPVFGATTDPEITISGYLNGAAPGDPAVAFTHTFSVATPDTATMQDILDEISAQFPGSSAFLDSQGNISLRSDVTGFTEESLASISYTPSTGAGATDSLSLPDGFKTTSVGGSSSQAVETKVYSSSGETIYLGGVLVETNEPNTWDLVVTSATTQDGTTLLSAPHRVSGIQFDNVGNYIGVENAGELSLTLTNTSTSTTQGITLELNSLTQYASSKGGTIACTQDGYEAGTLTDVTIDSSTGNVVGTFSNGSSINMATIAVATFTNPGGLEAVGDGFFVASANSGEAMVGAPGSGTAGSLVGQSLESSNVDMSSEFIKLIEAQHAYQANSKTIQSAQALMDILVNVIR